MCLGVLRCTKHELKPPPLSLFSPFSLPFEKRRQRQKEREDHRWIISLKRSTSTGTSVLAALYRAAYKWWITNIDPKRGKGDEENERIELELELERERERERKSRGDIWEGGLWIGRWLQGKGRQENYSRHARRKKRIYEWDVPRRGDADAAGWSQPWFRPSLIECSTLSAGKTTPWPASPTFQTGNFAARIQTLWRSRIYRETATRRESWVSTAPFFPSFLSFFYERTFFIIITFTEGKGEIPHCQGLCFAGGEELRSMV